MVPEMQRHRTRPLASWHFSTTRIGGGSLASLGSHHVKVFDSYSFVAVDEVAAGAVRITPCPFCLPLERIRGTRWTGF